MDTMSNKILILVFVVLVLLVAFIVNSRKEEFVEPPNNFTKSVKRKESGNYLSIFSNQKRITSDKDGSLSDDLEHGYDLEPFSNVSDDEQMVKLVAYLANNPHLYESSLVELKRDDEDEIYFRGKEVFKAPHIYEYSVSDNDVIAIEAVTKSEYLTHKNPSVDFDEEEKFFPVSYSEIWVIKPNQEPYKISPENINASSPRISNNAEKIAFTANALDQTNSPILSEFLVIYDLKTGAVQSYNTPNMGKDHYSITPVMWMNQDQTLRIVEDWGETGGHGQVGYVDFR
ncbi:hypothetical protein [Roseibacillus ishigakijimensis]|nr:hypothetical protein [Roseibacillus ishigakijimensis]